MKGLFFLFSLFISLQIFGQEEYIRSFHADLEVDESSLLTVTETIEIYAAGDQIRRGIVRSLPLKGTDYRYKTVKTDYKVISVKMNGQDVPYDTEKKQGSLYINVGDDSFLDPGWYTFQITYSAEGQLGYFDDYDELYWNVNGFGWVFRIENISAAVKVPKGATFLQNACYTGYSGSTEQNCRTEMLPDGRMIFRAENLASYQNLTIAAGFPKGIVSPPPPPTFWEEFGLLIFSGFTVIILLLYYVITWSKYGVDPPNPTVIPEFDPPSGLSPASIGMLHKGYFWGELISASIVHLAVNGYLRIEEKSKDQLFGIFKSTEFHLVKLKEEDDALPKEERKLMQYFFTNGKVAVIDGKYSSHFKSMYQAYMNSLVTEHTPFLTQGSNWKFWIGPIIIFIIYAFVASRFDFNQYGPPPTFDFNMEDIPIVPFVIFFLVFMVISFIRKKSANWLFVSLIMLGFLGGSFFLFSKSAISLNNFVLVAFIVFAVISFFTYIYLIRRPSVEKLDLRAKIDGFKRYLSTAEERQIQMFNPPQMTPEVFEKLLPYAMAFKVDKIWGQKFQTLMDRASLQNQHRTSWYSGSQSYSYGALGNHINRSLTSSINRSSGTNSSGGSGSSGGGSSGGGRGGGGGGGR
ncbi:DUF2207 domain-containing protein [Shivajiella indica]|uniref:DUF2207 domain-containing protein n=1 Tax=Shivajiella indica TaxID=872115 RepID=A0ABW5BFZ6_9BACT